MKIAYEATEKFIELNIDSPPKILVVEGFDFTGKSYLIEKLSSKFKVWEPKYDSDINNKVVPYNDRYALGIGLIDLVESEIINTPVIINRGLPSGIVYNKMYFQGNKFMDNPEFINYAKNKYSNPELIHTIYITHDSLINAKKLYDLSMKRSSNESYDKFDSFDQYIDVFDGFDTEYIKILNSICGDNYTILSSWDLSKLA